MASGTMNLTFSNNPYMAGRLEWTATAGTSSQNHSTVTVKVYAWRTNTGYTTKRTPKINFTINGTTYSVNATSELTFTYNSNTFCVTKTVTVNHNSDGTKTCAIGLASTSSLWDATSTTYYFNAVSQNVTFDKIARYTTLSEAYCIATGLTSASFRWTATDDCNYVRYYFNGSATATNVGSVSGKTGMFIKGEGLAPGTSYYLYIEVRRADSNLWTKSGKISFTTQAQTTFTSASCTSTTLNSATFSWAATDTCDFVRYYFNNTIEHTNIGVISASSGTFTKTGLTPGETYYLYIEVRKAANELWTKSAKITFTTKGKTTLKSISDTTPTIGRNLTYTLTNPSGTTSRIQVYVKDSGGGWGAAVYDYNSAPNSGTLSLSGVKAAMYDRAINRASTQYLVRVRCGDNAYYNDYTYNVNMPASTITVPTFTMGTSGTVSVSRDDANLTHTITYAFGTASGTIASGVTTSTTWSAPIATLAPKIPSATSGTGTITCKTYHGSALVGTTSKTFTANLPASIVPTFTGLTASELNTAVTTTLGVSAARIDNYVKSLSNIKFTINGAAGVYSSTISSYTITYKGSNRSGQTYTTSTIDWSGDQTVTAKVTDSRGRSATKSITISALNYSRPVISAYTVSRCTSSGVLDEMGEYVKLIRTGSASSLMATDEKNRITAKAYYKKTSNTAWTEILIAGVGVTDSTNLTGALSDTVYIVPDVLATDSYVFKLDVSDKFYTTTVERTVSSGVVVMSMSATGVGIGKVWQQGALDVKGDVFVNGNPLGGNTLDSLPVGMSMPWYSEALPSSKWLAGEGQSLDSYPEAQIVWGSNLPDTRGKTLVGKTATGTFSTLGATVGSETTTAVPSHSHTINHDHPAVTSGSGGVAHTHSITHDHPAVTSGSQSANHTHTGTTGNPSANHTHSIPALSGTAASAGAHTHGVRYKHITGINVSDSSGYIFLRRTDSGDSYTGTDSDAANSAGAHTHSVTTVAKTSGTVSAWHTHTMTTGGNSVGHTHSVNLPSFSGTSGAASATSHTHSVDVGAYSGSSGSTGTSSVSLVQPSLVVRWIFKVVP